MSRAKLEICVDSLAGLTLCRAAGVDTIELCSALDLGGLTPGPGLIAAAAEPGGPPVQAMIRPRAGGFSWSRAELVAMLRELAAMREAGLAGVVIGATRDAAGAELDVATLRVLCREAEGLRITLHRCVDLLPHPEAAVGVAAELGIHRILTSGGAVTAPQGVEVLARMVELAAGSVEIVAGSGVTPDNLPVLATAGLRSFHASARVQTPQPPGLVRLGFAMHEGAETDAGRIAALQEAVRLLR